MMATAFLGFNLAQNGDVYLHGNLTFIHWSIAPVIQSKRLAAILAKCKDITPIHTWENLHPAGIKDTIYPILKQVAGIYLVVNLVTGEKYVGSAVLGRMHIRFHKHLYGGSGSQPLWNAVQKYGLENFAFLVIDQIPEFTSNDNQQLLDLETQYILNHGDYNILTEAGNTTGYNHTDATREAMRLNYSNERREQIGSLNRGKSPSTATVELMRQAALARPPMSQEARDKVSSNSAKAMLYQLTTLTGTALGSSTVLRTIPKVSEFCACDEKTVRRALKGTGIIKRKWSIKTLGPAK